MRTNAFLLILLMFGITACGGDTLVVTMEPGEKWWGAIDDPSNRRISPRTSFPFDEDSDFTLDLVYNNYSNNAVPFLVSNHGRYIWNDDPFVLTVKNGKLKCIEQDMGNAAMTDPSTLSSFIQYCSKNYPANRNELKIVLCPF